MPQTEPALLPDPRFQATLTFEHLQVRDETGKQTTNQRTAVIRLPALVYLPGNAIKEPEEMVEERPLGRLRFALQEVNGAHHVEAEHNFNAGHPGLQAPTFRVSYGPLNAAATGRPPNVPEELILQVVTRYRHGDLVAPPATVEQHREMVRLGVAQRKDGLWGWKPFCRRDGCPNRVKGKCFAALDLADALKQAATRRCEWACGMTCGLLEDGADIWWPGIWTDIQNNPVDADAKKARDLLARICTATGLLYRPDDEEETLPNGVPDLKKLRAADPALFKEFVDWFNENCDTDGDPGDPEEGEVDCEA